MLFFSPRKKSGVLWAPFPPYKLVTLGAHPIGSIIFDFRPCRWPRKGRHRPVPIPARWRSRGVQASDTMALATNTRSHEIVGKGNNISRKPNQFQRKKSSSTLCWTKSLGKIWQNPWTVRAPLSCSCYKTQYRFIFVTWTARRLRNNMSCNHSNFSCLARDCSTVSVITACMRCPTYPKCPLNSLSTSHPINKRVFGKICTTGSPERNLGTNCCYLLPS